MTAAAVGVLLWLIVAALALLVAALAAAALTLLLHVVRALHATGLTELARRLGRRR